MDKKFHTNLIVSSAPHIVTDSDTTRLMGTVLLALAPAFIASVYIFGVRVILLAAVCMVASVAFEYLFNLARKKDQTVGDLSAALTGLLIEFGTAKAKHDHIDNQRIEQALEDKPQHTFHFSADTKPT